MKAIRIRAKYNCNCNGTRCLLRGGSEAGVSRVSGHLPLDEGAFFERTMSMNITGNA